MSLAVLSCSTQIPEEPPADVVPDTALRTCHFGTTEWARRTLPDEPSGRKAPSGIAALPEFSRDMTASNELLYLCVLLVDTASDKEYAKQWYLEAEQRYMHGTVTELFTCYQAMEAALRAETRIPILPPLSANKCQYSNGDFNDFDLPSAENEWIWAVRAVQFGNDNYLPKAWAWARQIKDLEIREEAESKMTRLFSDFDASLQFSML